MQPVESVGGVERSRRGAAVVGPERDRRCDETDAGDEDGDCDCDDGDLSARAAVTAGGRGSSYRCRVKSRANVKTVGDSKRSLSGFGTNGEK
ncbi:hypothetical protein [Halorussus caseinilyticus]|uniref:Uncharacterized protein n=1 Tax=Halorussus caseinilyticus TaxID=3034025 RepID=A0ABD5WMT3_9EURY